MLDIRIVFWRVRYDMVNVVISFPPADRQTTEEVCNKYADAGIDVEIVGDAHVASIMGCEDQLMPEDADEEARESILAVV